MVEQEAVNFEVAGSSPVPGAIEIKEGPQGLILFLWLSAKRILGPASWFEWSERQRATSLPSPGSQIKRIPFRVFFFI